MTKQSTTLLATLFVTDTDGKHGKVLKVYQSQEGLRYTQFSDGTMEADIPTLHVKRGSYLSYTYNPAETVYTGATTGSVHMGGFYTREASYSERKVSSDRGYIQVSTRCDKFLLTKVTIPQEIQNRFRRDSEFKALVSNGTLSCIRHSDAAHSVRSAMTGRENIYEATQLLSIAQDRKHLDYDCCHRIARLLKRILRGDFPPTIDVIYNQAVALTKAQDSQSLRQAKEMFCSIVHYRDSAAQAAALESALKDAILREEKKKADAPKVLIRIVLLAIFLILVASVLSIVL